MRGDHALPQVRIRVLRFHRGHPCGGRADAARLRRAAVDRRTDLDRPDRVDEVAYLSKLLFAIGVLLATALFFGMFFIYPLIRTQVREEGKLRAMTASLSARSETLRAGGTDRRADRHAEPALFRRCAEGISRGVPPHRQAGRADDPRPRPLQAGQRHAWPRCRRRGAARRRRLPQGHDALSRRRRAAGRRGVRRGGAEHGRWRC